MRYLTLTLSLFLNSSSQAAPAPVNRLDSRLKPPATIERPRGVTIEQLRAQISASAEAAPRQQFINIGPMKDGRKLSITAEVKDSSSSAVYITPVGQDISIITMGRKLTLESVFLIDATIICAHFRKEVCGRLESYFDLVRSSRSLTDIPFLEQAFPELRAEASSSREDSALYYASLQAGIGSLVFMATWHEVGHAALHNLDDDTSDIQTEIEQEGEADGFASYMAKLSNIPTAGLAAAFLLDTVEEHLRGKTPVVHPPARCRAAMMATQTVQWLQQNEPAATLPSGNKERDNLVNGIYSQLSSSNVLVGLNPDGVRACKRYVLSFSSGVAKGISLIDQNTKLDSVVSGQR